MPLGSLPHQIVREIGGFRSEFDEAQDYDLVLRITSRTNRIRHIPDILYHWRKLPTSTAAGAQNKPNAHYKARNALQAYLNESQHLGHFGGKVEKGPSVGFHRLRYHIPRKPLISIVIPSACQKTVMNGKRTWFLYECLKSIAERTTYKNYEVIVIDNNDMPDSLKEAIKPFSPRIVSFTEEFNLARKMNFGVENSRGEFVILLNDDIEVISRDWIESMLEFSQQKGVGAVGCKLLFPNNHLQHVGVNILNGNPGHPYYDHEGFSPGYYRSAEVIRNSSAVTGACLMTPRDLYLQLGGFSEELPLNYNDVDYCLKLRKEQYRIVYTPFAELYHHESVSKSGVSVDELEQFKDLWSKEKWDSPLNPVGGNQDPYYNPNLTVHFEDYRIDPTHIAESKKALPYEKKPLNDPGYKKVG